MHTFNETERYSVQKQDVIVAQITPGLRLLLRRKGSVVFLQLYIFYTAKSINL